MIKNFTFIDLFSGIGGFHSGLSKIGGKCVFASDILPIARETYYHNYKIQPFGDITKIKNLIKIYYANKKLEKKIRNLMR